MTESISRKFSKLGPHVSATGTITTNAATASAWETARTLTLSGDVSGNVSIDGSENVTLTATVSGNSVALGTDTTGDYVASITNGNYITGGNGGSEGATLTLSVDATSDNTASKVVARDASGNFSAGTITATLSGNASTATTWATGRTIALTGDVTGTSGAFDGSGNISISTTIAADSVALGTDTTGDYVAAVAVSGTGLSVSGSGENATYTITSNATSANTASTIVARDASGNFTAGTITATLSGSSTSTDLINSVGITGNLDTMYQARTFGWEPSTNGRPTDQYGQGIAVVSAGNTHNNTNNWITQLGFGTNMNTAYFRTKVNADSWGAWHTLIHSGNYTSYSPSLTGTGASGTWGINITGNANNITQYTVNQSVGTGNSPTFYNLYANQWFRNNTANTGLYNESTTQHWSSGTNGYWDASSTNTVSGIRFYTGGHVSALRGYVYADTSNSIGFLNSGGSWRLRVIGDDYTQVDGSSIRASLYYDLNNTTYYTDPASVSRMSGIGVGETYYSHGYPGILQLGSTGYNYNFSNGTWSSSITVGILANCADQWEFAIHDSGERVVSPFIFYGGASNYIYMGRDLGWGTTYIEAASSFRAPIFYDSNNTGYYADPASTSIFNVLRFGTSTNTGRFDGESTWGVRFRTDSGYIHFGPANANHAHIYTDRSNFYFNNTLTVNGGSVINTGDIRSAIFYDIDNTGYYVNPASTSILNVVNTGNTLYINNNGESVATSSFRGINFHTDADLSYYIGKPAGAWTQPLNITFYTGIRLQSHQSYGGTQFYNFSSGGTVMAVNNGDNNVHVYTALYSTIMYDENNTGYYVDPASTSNLNALQTYSYQGNGNVGGTGNAAWFPSGLYVASGLPAWLYGPIYRNGQNTFGGGTAEYTIVYDNNDSNYYVDPNGTSRLNRVDPNEIYNHGWFRNLGDSGWYSQAYGYGAWWAQSGGNSYGNATTYGTGRNGWSGWGIGSRHVFMSTTGDNVGVHDNSRGWIWYWNGSYTEFPFGYTIHGGSSRSPIFYDQNDTNWYCDPNSTSRFWTLSLENRLYIYGGNPGDPGSDTTPQVFFKTGGGMGLSGIEIDYWTGFTGSSYPNNFQIGFRMAYDKRLYVWQDLVQYYSDERLKEKTGTLAGALDAIKAWTPFKYVDNALANSFNFGSGRTQIGLSAQEVQQYYPELVDLAPFDAQSDFSDETNPRTISKSGENYLTLNYTRLVPVLIQAIKEQQAKIEELENRINNS